MSAMITRRSFMRGAGAVALAGCGLMLTGCGIVDSIVKDTVKSYSDNSLDMGKYTVLDANAEWNHLSKDENNNVLSSHLRISFGIYNADSALNGKASTSFISNVTIDGTTVDDVYEDEPVDVTNTDAVITTVSTANASVEYYITLDQYKAFFENGKELKFTVTLAGHVAEYTLTYNKSTNSSTATKIDKKS